MYIMKKQNELQMGFISFMVILMFFCVMTLIYFGLITGNIDIMYYMFVPLIFEWIFVLLQDERF